MDFSFYRLGCWRFCSDYWFSSTDLEVVGLNFLDSTIVSVTPSIAEKSIYMRKIHNTQKSNWLFLHFLASFGFWVVRLWGESLIFWGFDFIEETRNPMQDYHQWTNGASDVIFMAEMETEERNQRGSKIAEPEFFLQWGNRKRLRCVRVKDPRISSRLNGGIRRKLTSTLDRSGFSASDKEISHLQQPNRLTRSESTKPTKIFLHHLCLVARKSQIFCQTGKNRNLFFWWFWRNVWLGAGVPTERR